MKDKNGNIIKKDDVINISGLQTKVNGFSVVAGQPMICTDYGNFAPDIVEIIITEN